MLINNSALSTGLNGQEFTGEIFKDDATKEKILNHILNPNDTITEDDLRKVKTEMTPATIEEERQAAQQEGIDIPGDGL